MTGKKNIIGNKVIFQNALFVVALVLTVIVIGTGSIQQQNTVQVGSVATKRYVAAEDTVDIVATDKLKEAAANSVGPIYKTDISISEKCVVQVEGVFEELDMVLAKLGEEENYYDAVQNTALELPIVLLNKQLSAYQALTPQQRKDFVNDCISVLQTIYENGITADGMEQAKQTLQNELAKLSWHIDLKTMASMILTAAVEPNLIVDNIAIETMKEQKRTEVSDVLIRKNQKIVDEGEIITQEIYDKLVALHLVSESGIEGNVMPLLGSLLMTSMVFAAMYLFFIWGRNARPLKKNEVRMLFTIYSIMIMLISLLSNLKMFTLIPAGLFAMLVSLLIGRRTALWLNALFCIVGCFICNGDVQFLMYALLSGTFAALIIQKTDKRAYLIPATLGMAVVNFAAMMALGFFFGEGYFAELLFQSGIGAATGLVSMIVAVGSLPFWETVFEANTPLRLMELTNPNSELLRKLMIEAPGTYHHSLIVANLVETAVYDIGGNTALARAGAYYHDVGKLKYPLYFAENQTGYNPHNDLSPEKSAKIITNHTKDGLELAQRYKLPPVIQDIIVEHHGTGLVKYFYFQALKQYGAEQVDEKNYRYQGKIPSSREAAVVMLADTVEAAVRSMLGSGKTLDEAEQAIKGLIKDKLDDGQLNNSGLTINELEVIRQSFLKVFHGMYHERVAYPKQADIQAAEKKPKTIQEETTNDNTD